MFSFQMYSVILEETFQTHGKQVCIVITLSFSKEKWFRFYQTLHNNDSIHKKSLQNSLAVFLNPLTHYSALSASKAV